MMIQARQVVWILFEENESGSVDSEESSLEDRMSSFQ